jgi:hypothetical protein
MDGADPVGPDRTAEVGARRLPGSRRYAGRAGQYTRHENRSHPENAHRRTSSRAGTGFGTGALPPAYVAFRRAREKQKEIRPREEQKTTVRDDK